MGQLLSEVEKSLRDLRIAYKVTTTKPTRNIDSLDEEKMYVIRQQIDEQGCYTLVVAAKMKGIQQNESC